jgi:MFS family permease
VTAAEQARLALNAYSPGWRREHGEALIGTLLDAAEAHDRDRLTWAELADTVVQGLLQRSRLVTHSGPARLLGRTGLLVGGALALTGLILGELAPQYSARAAAAQALMERQHRLYPVPGPLGPFPTTGPVLYLAWIALLLAALFGRAWLIRRLAVIAVLLAAVLTLSENVGLNRPPLTMLALLGWAAALVAVAPWQRRAGTRSAVNALVLTAIATPFGLNSVLHANYYWAMFPWYSWFTSRNHHSGLGTDSSSHFALNLVGVTLLIAVLVRALESIGRRAFRSSSPDQTSPEALSTTQANSG